jgi:hypothetical protein
MKMPDDENSQQKDSAEAENLRILRHDIYNQLSNIYLSIEQLRHEIPENCNDCSFYLDSIFLSSVKINSLLKQTEQ